MDKKELKFYETPACEVLELKLQGMLCVSGDQINPGEGESGGESGDDPGSLFD